MSKTNKHTHLPRAAWENHVENWKNSSLTKAAYCRQKNLVYSQFIYWSSKFKTQEATPMLVAVPSSPVAVPVAQRSGPVSGIKLHLNACYLDIPDGFNEDTLTRILSLLEKGPSHASG